MSITNNEKLFWPPGVQWEFTDSKLNVQGNIFHDISSTLFPKFYHLTLSGITLVELIKAFPNIPENELMSFVRKMFERKLLVTNIQGVQEMFFHQGRLFQGTHESDPLMKVNKELVENYKIEQLKRTDWESNDQEISLDPEDDKPDFITNRKTTRKFDTSKLVDFSQFSQLLSILRQRIVNDYPQYYFGSAGGLYPIDYYIYIKPERVESMQGGLYIYSPVKNSVKLIDSNLEFHNDIHFFTNKEIFDTSALTLFLVYNADVSMPKYDGMAYYYGILDCGIIAHALALQASYVQLGSCSIGDINFMKVEQSLSLSSKEKLLHTIEFGLPL